MRIISEGQAAELLHTHFALHAPVAFENVKKRYREESKKLHPDAGGSEEAFKALVGAFDELRHLYQSGSHLFDAEPGNTSSEPRMPRKTIDDTPLSELGLGLGPTTNGRDCPECEHRGYTVTKEHGRAECESCGGLGTQPREYACRACGGSGKFRQRLGAVVNCRKCNGTGRFKHPHHEEWCKNCGGLGKTRGPAVTRIYVHKCWSCKGTGEIEVLNPVLPKGRLAHLSFSPNK